MLLPRVILLMFLRGITFFARWMLLSPLPVAMFSPRVLARFVNVTVDDEWGDPLTGEQIAYNNSWVQGTSCSCWARPVASRTYNGTWHDGTYATWPGDPDSGKIQTATFNFTGACQTVSVVPWI